MFTGIIREIGTVAALRKSRGLVQLDIRAPRTAGRVGLMESVAINGVCLTVVGVEGSKISFEVIPETQRLTGLRDLAPGRSLHVEPSLALSDRMNGHVVLGHVDGLGKIARRQARAAELTLWIEIPAAMRKLIVPKGPIAVDGVSLTVGESPTRKAFASPRICRSWVTTTVRSPCASRHRSRLCTCRSATWAARPPKN